MTRSRTGAFLVLFLLLAVAGALRWVSLGATSLWWDELVQIQTASLPRFADVLGQVRRGDPPGLGNAGAVPLDYLLMHAWQRFVPAPGAPWIEAYFRFPSWLSSTAAVGALFLYARRWFGPAAALVAAVLLATSVPHILYAGEARFYSLFTFVTILCLWAFSWVVREPQRLLPWLLHALVGILTFLTGLLGLLLLAGQYAILLYVLLRAPVERGHAARPRAPLLVLGLILAAFAGVLWCYYRGTWIFLRLQHADEGRGPWQATREILSFFTIESPLLLGLFVVSLVLVPLALRADRSRGPVAFHLVSSFLWIPALAWLATWKGYYVHPRHALFLLPYLALLTGIGLDLLLRRGRASGPLLGGRSVLGTFVAIAIVGVAQLAPLREFLADPLRAAAHIKPTYDTKALASLLAARVRALPEDRIYLLVADRGPGAYLRNPAIAWYLRRYGLGERVALRTTATSAGAIARLEELCGAAPDRCAERWVQGLADEMELSASIQVRETLRQLLGIDSPELLPTRRLGAVGILRPGRDLRRPDSRLRLELDSAPGWALLEWHAGRGS